MNEFASTPQAKAPIAWTWLRHSLREYYFPSGAAMLYCHGHGMPHFLIGIDY
jgi:hypothetical protein